MKCIDSHNRKSSPQRVASASWLFSLSLSLWFLRLELGNSGLEFVPPFKWFRILYFCSVMHSFFLRGWFGSHIVFSHELWVQKNSNEISKGKSMPHFRKKKKMFWKYTHHFPLPLFCHKPEFRHIIMLVAKGIG